MEKLKALRTFQAYNNGKLEVFEQGKEYKASSIKDVIKEHKKEFG
ncbi:hypothetical protein [Ekhidna sp.]